MIRFRCPGCGVTLRAGDDQAGLAEQCPNCQTPFLVPSAGLEPTDNQSDDLIIVAAQFTRKAALDAAKASIPIARTATKKAVSIVIAGMKMAGRGLSLTFRGTLATARLFATLVPDRRKGWPPAHRRASRKTKFRDTAYLIVDTETTGLPDDRDAPASDLANWPRLVELAFLLVDLSGNVLLQQRFLVFPDGFEIPAAATRKHGITTNKARAEGVPLWHALNEFSAALQSATTLVAHNMDFDEKVLGAEFIRMRLPDPIRGVRRVCTMKSSTAYCNLPGYYDGPKWPTLSELHVRLFRTDYEGDHHRAGNDVVACAKCFFALKQLRVIR